MKSIEEACSTDQKVTWYIENKNMMVDIIFKATDGLELNFPIP